VLEEIGRLVSTRFWARFQVEVQEAIRTLEGAGASLAGANPLADLAPPARAELLRQVERLETGEQRETDEILASLRDLSEAIRPGELELMLEGYLPMSEAGYLCRELESLLDPATTVVPTPSELRAAAAVSWPRLWAEFVEEKRSDFQTRRPKKGAEA